MELIPIKINSKSPNEYCEESYIQTLEYYKVIGYHEPWISYYFSVENEIVGICSFKGKPDKNSKVEIAYCTFEQFQGKGYANKMCSLLLDIAKMHNNVHVFARTLPEMNASTMILTKNGFKCIGSVIDPEDGDVWEWVAG